MDDGYNPDVGRVERIHWMIVPEFAGRSPSPSKFNVYSPSELMSVKNAAILSTDMSCAK